MAQLGPQFASDDLETALGSGNPDRVEAAVATLAAEIGSADTDVAGPVAVRALKVLRGERLFPAMLRVAEGAFRAGVDDVVVSRQYAQALIDQGLLTASLAVLDTLRQTPGSEADEVAGLVGRAHKQHYVENPTGPGAGAHLRAAIDAYLARYNAAPDRNRWHGINAVALLARAERDQRPGLASSDWRAMARQLLDSIAAHPGDAWDEAVAAEAHVALGNFEDAAKHLEAFTRKVDADAFAFAGALRQLDQVWEIDKGDVAQRSLVDLLEARLLCSEGGRLTVRPDERAGRAGQLDVDAQYLEAVLGTDKYKTVQWYRAGLEAARSVVRVVHPLSGTVGTGFVVPRKAFASPWGDQLVVMTNFHVANRHGVHPGRRAADLRVEFEDNGVHVAIRDILWESPHVALGTNPPPSVDTAILLLDASVPEPSYQLSPGPMPAVDDRVYVIGYPQGKALAFSLNDNALIGVNDTLMHYRAPTDPGSSGSPVFDGEWRVIGLHHGGGRRLTRLDDRNATYAANEGIVFSAVEDHVGRAPT